MVSIDGMTIGFVGLGLMGKPMCRNLIDGGAQLVATNRSEAPRVEIAEAGAAVVDSPAEVAARTRIIVVMVADTAAVDAVLNGENGLLSRIEEETLIIDMGTTSVPATREFGERVRAKGGDLSLIHI